MKTEVSVEIDRPIEEVFRLTTNDVAQWSEVVLSDETIDDRNNGGVGTTFRTVCEGEGNHRMTFEGQVVQHDPPVMHVIKMNGEAFNIEAAYSFEELRGNKTRVTQFSKVDGKGIFAVIFTCFGWMMKRNSCKAAQKEMNNLKQYCERAAVPA